MMVPPQSKPRLAKRRETREAWDMSVVPPVLIALAEAFRESAAGRGGGTRDFTIDFEKLLRRSGLADGDAREQAERDLAEAVGASGGSLGIDRHARSGLPQRVRLMSGRGETWLFDRIGDLPPAAAREAVAGAFREAADLPVPEVEREAWRKWLHELAEAAMEGGSVVPFSRDDAGGNREILGILAGILAWPHESLIRYASSRLCGDSKALQRLRPRLEAALQGLRGRAGGGLDDFGIREVPRSVLLHGPLRLRFGGAVTDLGLLSGPVRISGDDISRSIPETDSAHLLTVENESVFLELTRRNPGVLIIHTSFPGAATRMLLDKLPAWLECHHFGDTDPAGFDILRDLREKTGRAFQPFMMRPRPGGVPLDAADLRTLDRLLGHPLMGDLHGLLAAIRAGGTKGAFEQEGVDLGDVLEEMNQWRE